MCCARPRSRVRGPAEAEAHPAVSPGQPPKDPYDASGVRAGGHRGECGRGSCRVPGDSEVHVRRVHPLGR
eukprot:9056702-Lingulodinium_polyedra.AAC.1